MALELNENQKKAAYYDGDKYLVIEAGPGAGKTHVLIERIKFLINAKNIDPSSLLVITFTRKAADELKERLSENIDGSKLLQMHISTIHSFCRIILSEMGEQNFNIISDNTNEKLKMFISKHREELGFVREFSLHPYDLTGVIKKYNEYATFGVMTEDLVEYIEKNKPISEDYINFVKEYMEEHDNSFPYKEIKSNKKFKRSWYNARYLQIARSYPKYLELLERENFSDFSQMQIKALDYLRENPKTRFTNVLIDEFQDTDPVQMQMFEILMENAESFTVVGDIDQSIYGFRGANKNYFDYLYNNYDDNVFKVNLNVNYRSSNQIIKLSEDFIKTQRTAGSKVDAAIGARNEDRNSYFLVNNSHLGEAEEIFEFIKYLHDKEIIENFNEIAILTRTVKFNNTLTELIPLFNENNIPYYIKGLSDLFEKDEIKSVLTLLHHLIQDTNPHNFRFTEWELDWLDLKAYTGERFNQKCFNLSDETKSILNKVQDDFERLVLKTEKEVTWELKGFRSKKYVYKRVFERDDEILEEIFRRIERPILTDENLIGYGITDKYDLDFFKRLNNLKKYISSDEFFKSYDTIQNVYIRLLSDVCNYITEDFVNDENNIEELKNLSVISNTFNNYELIINNKNFKGAVDFLFNNIKTYSTENDESNSVQVMTVHSAKGLEFPVVILLSLDEKRFPLEYKDPDPPSGYINKIPTFYTPDYCLEYKNILTEQEAIEENDEEEERIIYVAMTRAQDILVLSNLVKDASNLDEYMELVHDKDLSIIEKRNALKDVPKANLKIENLINSNLDNCKLLDEEPLNISKTTCKKPLIQKEESINLSFNSLEDYINCPFKYKLIHEFKFKKSTNDYKIKGLFVHNVFEIINNNIKNNKKIDDEDIKNIMLKLHNSFEFNRFNPTLSKINEILNDVLYYYHNFASSFKVLECERPFKIKEESYKLSGVIDLIYETKDGKIGILDYKNTRFTSPSYIKKYIKQVYTYLIALDEHNIHIDELRVYAIKSREMIVIELNNSSLTSLKRELNDISIGIDNAQFECNPSKDCESCSFSNICKRSIVDDDNSPLFNDNYSNSLKNRFYDNMPDYKVLKLDNPIEIDTSLFFKQEDLVKSKKVKDISENKSRDEKSKKDISSSPKNDNLSHKTNNDVSKFHKREDLDDKNYKVEGLSNGSPLKDLINSNHKRANPYLSQKKLDAIKNILINSKCRNQFENRNKRKNFNKVSINKSYDDLNENNQLNQDKEELKIKNHLYGENKELTDKKELKEASGYLKEIDNTIKKNENDKSNGSPLKDLINSNHKRANPYLNK